ncbi:hypothetical protein EG328_005590 [Venturia inaequalis]|uniref:Uncharacterized protein n=1 Tax=Venturia inaequalis TaxID=5025 RepID=A0A8H3VHH1_VENIN|nr:hypothetical protein EG328_005590 [Venturia inaequalis]
MDLDEHVLPTALFSPSKAAAQRAQAQDWHTIDVWLSSKYQGRSVPTFERNEDTLKILRELVAANERGDEERDLIWGVWSEGLGEMKRGMGETNSPLTADLTNGLPPTGLIALSSLSTLAIELNTPSCDALSIVETVTNLTLTQQTLTQSLIRLTQLQKRLETHLQSLWSANHELRSENFQAPRELARQTLDWNRNTKQLRSKITEYNDRLSTLNPYQGSPSPYSSPRRNHSRSNTVSLTPVEEVVEKEKRLLELGEKVRELEEQVKAYKGLPKDKDDARKVVEKIRKENDKLRQKRDRLFEGLVGG